MSNLPSRNSRGKRIVHPHHLYEHWGDDRFPVKMLEKAMPWIEGEFLQPPHPRLPLKIANRTYLPGFFVKFEENLALYREMESNRRGLKATMARQLFADVFYWRSHLGLIKLE